MLRNVLALSTLSLLAVGAAAQSGRSMKLVSPVVLGQIASVAITHPTSIAGNLYAIATCSPSFPGTTPLVIPGLINGTLRLDPNSFSIVTTGLLNTSGQSQSLSFFVPNVPTLVGYSLDFQGVDLGANGLLTLTDNDLELVVAAPPLGSLTMQPINPGSFQMGGTVFPTEAPIHTVTISRSFWMSRTEVTQPQYQAVMGTNPSQWPNPSQPVERVTWFMAVAYCDALNVQEAAAGRLPSGYEYRLPTEAEWEYCCRAGTTTDYHFGNTITCNDANVTDAAFNQCVGMTRNVGAYAANAFGLQDMHGNVAEWCLDASDLISSYAPGDAVDPYVATGPYRVLRGGAWSGIPIYTRSAARAGNDPTVVNFNYGFRVVLAPTIP